ncbi:hypothetical protein BBC27_05190 [Acidithiobacillus ferrivorans]|uniref:Uncharacterized protein n=2 Tax=Acidithiobacillus ferrivorans TaxID=160808 RepID=A0A1B9C2B3_9PROT|nr:hypothetical protein BBC27_05190 [Acidithiobacillus ferrivorans]QQD73985.1 hypothetical protein H2515_07145 [Acidithiobacillus ferrivorans]
MTNDLAFWLCVSNVDYEVSLETRKVYEGMPDPEAQKMGMIRVIDESGEDYLFPVSLFLPIALPHDVAVAVHRLAV